MAAIHCVVLLALCTAVAGYSKGPPVGACDHMNPVGHGASQQNKTAPYKVYAGTHNYKAGESVKVGIYGTEEIEGFFIQARDATNHTIRIGSWMTTMNDTKLMNCTAGAHDAVSHSEELHDIHNIDLTWHAPSNQNGTVSFLATLVRHKDTFWVKVPSIVGTAPTYKKPDVKTTSAPTNTASYKTISLTTMFAAIAGSLLF